MMTAEVATSASARRRLGEGPGVNITSNSSHYTAGPIRAPVCNPLIMMT
jgi:hypothetical protein